MQAASEARRFEQTHIHGFGPFHLLENEKKIAAEESKEISEWFIASVCKLWVISEKRSYRMARLRRRIRYVF